MVLSEEDVAALRADLARAQQKKEQKIGNMSRSLRGFGEKGRWAHPSTG